MTTTTTRADLSNPGADSERGLFDEIKEDLGDALDLFTGVDQSDVAKGRVNLDDLPREDRIELLIDGETSSVFGSSPWSVGAGLDASVAQQIHEDKGATLVFAIRAGFFDAAEAAARAVRYALVWDDSIVSDTGTLTISLIGQTFLIVGVGDEPQGKRLTLWITDDDLEVALVRQGTKQDLEKIRKEVVGEIGAAAGKEPNALAKIADDAFGFLTATQLGGVVALGLAAVVLIVLIRSEAFKDVAAVAAKAVK